MIERCHETERGTRFAGKIFRTGRSEVTLKRYRSFFKGISASCILTSLVNSSSIVH